MPSWVSGPDGEKAWNKAKGIVREQYGAGLEKSDPDRFYSLVTTVYKSVCKSPDFSCGVGKAESFEPGTMGEMIAARQMLAEEEITDAWIKGVRKWWLQWKKGEKKALPNKGHGEYTKKDICAAYKFLAEGIKRIRRIRDNLLYVQGFWPYGATGQKNLDPRQMRGNYVLMGKDGEVATYKIKDFQSRFVYKIDDIENMLWGFADKFADHCNTWDDDPRTGEDASSDLWWDVTFDRARQKLKRADRVLLDEIFNRLKKLKKEVFDPAKKAREELSKGGTSINDPFPARLPEAKIGRVTLVLDTRPLEYDPVTAFKVYGGEDQRSPKVMKEYVKFLVRAQKMLEQRGLKKLWYGTVFVCPEKAGLSKLDPSKEKSDWAKSRGKTFQAGADYYRGKDVIRIYADPHHFLRGGFGTRDLLHELAHRYWDKFMTPAQRNEWSRNFGKADFATEYAGRNAEEEFAENFSFYVLGKLKGPHAERIRSVMRESVDPQNELEHLAEALASFCEAVSSKKLREAEQMKGWHEQDAANLRKTAEEEGRAKAKATLDVAEIHEKAAQAFGKALAFRSAKDLRAAKQARKEALLAERNRG